MLRSPASNVARRAEPPVGKPERGVGPPSAAKPGIDAVPAGRRLLADELQPRCTQGVHRVSTATHST